jgi:hypothetical protein
MRGLFTTNSPCWPTGISVEKGKHYRVFLDVVDPWAEGGKRYTNPIGFDSGEFGGLPNFVAAIARRSISGRWFQPIVRIWGVSNEVHVLNINSVNGQTFVGTFTAGIDGTLFLFVNDLMYSHCEGVSTGAYKDNRGSATVRIERF